MVRATLAGLLVMGATVARGQNGFVNWESPHVHPLALTPDGTRLLAVNTADNRLEIFDVSGGSPVWTASVPVGLDPVSVRARSNTEAWVVNHVSDSISIVDLASGRVVRTILTGDEPADVVFAGAPERAFVTLSQLNQVAVYDPANPAAAPTVVGIQGEDPRALAVSPDGGTVYAAIFESGNKTTIIDRPTVSSPAGPYGGVNPPPNAGNVFDPPRPPGQPAPPPVSQIVRQAEDDRWLDDNDRDWSSQVTWGLHDQDVAIIDAATLGVSYAQGMMTTVMGLAVTASGRVTAVGTEALNQIRFEPNVNGIFIRVQMASFEAAAPGTVGIVDLNPHLDYAAPSVPPATRALSIGDPRAIAWHFDESLGYVAGMGSNNVLVIDAFGGVVDRIATAQGPTGMALSPTEETLYILNKFDGSVQAVDTASREVVGTATFHDPTPTSIKQGRPFLYATHLTSGLGQAACASCHIDGRTDHLAWDLGNPAGTVQDVTEACRQGLNCRDWHPMKGPMVTQTLQGIIGNEPLHWRGDRTDLAAFAPAFTGLQGADAVPSASELQQFTDFVATITYPPNPNRNLDGTLRTTLATSTGTGNPAAGLNIYNNQPVFGGGLTCRACHPLPLSSDNLLDSPPVAPQTLKDVQLRNMHEKAGFSRTSMTNNRGFGYNHDGEGAGLNALMSLPPFNFPPGGIGAQQRRDLEAFLLSLSTDTHAAVGQQVTFNGTNNGDPALIGRFNTFINLASAGTVGLVAKGHQDGLARGYVYVGNGQFQSDRSGEFVPSLDLRLAAAAGSEVTFTAVPTGTQLRIGIDRDTDGHFDRDELDGCSDPADPQSIPPVFGDLDGSGGVDVDDVLCGLNGFASFSSCPTGDLFPCGGDGQIDVDDLLALLDAFGGIRACPGSCAITL